MEDRILVFPVSSATVEEAAIAARCEEKVIVKTMSFIVENKAILVLIPGDKKIDNQKYKTRFLTRPVMAKPDELARMIGHSAGGVCPFGTNKGVAVYLDVSLKRFEYVFPGCGSENSLIRLSLEELKKHSGFSEWIDVCKDRADIV